MIPVETKCKEFGEPGCLGTPDPQYTMSFEDIGQGCLYFCSHCGPEAHAMHDLVMDALATKGPEFAKQFDAALTRAENQSDPRN